MLIDSPRITDADRAVWEMRERDDERRARSRRVDMLTARAQATIRAFCGQAYCAVSWGKDSVVVAHLVRSVAPETTLVWVRLLGADNPDCEAVRDAFLAGWPMPYVEVDDKAPAMIGGARKSGALRDGFDRAADLYGPGHFSGVRAAESSTRRLSAMVHGLATERSCRPILYWQASDVWAYLRRHDLPVHPAYAMSDGGRRDRDWLRVASIGGERGAENGRRSWERMYYPDVLSALASE